MPLQKRTSGYAGAVQSDMLKLTIPKSGLIGIGDRRTSGYDRFTFPYGSMTSDRLSATVETKRTSGYADKC
jgi:hypothetical protein